MKQTEVLLSREALVHNFKKVRELAAHAVWPVIKSNAYGHGSREVVSVLDELEFSHYIVQNLYEAQELFDATNKKFLILGTQSDDSYLSWNHDRCVPTVSSLRVLKLLGASNYSGPIHLEINTGMNRVGIEVDDISQALSLVREYKLSLEGVMTHFSNSNEPKALSLKKQQERFQHALNTHPELAGAQYIHANNSAAITSGSLTCVNLSRSGRAPIGYRPYTHHEFDALKPVLRYITHIVQVKDLKPGETIGYGDSYVVEKPMRIAVLPVGYHEGMPRALGNKGFVLVGDHLCPIVGRISMNVTTIDITDHSHISVGDEVDLMSSSIPNAEILDTIDYEITTNIKAHIPRRIV